VVQMFGGQLGLSVRRLKAEGQCKHATQSETGALRRDPEDMFSACDEVDLLC
jgi:hypothetical protein